MRSIFHIFIIIGLFAGGAGSLSFAAGQVSVTASVDQQTAYIGDLINYKVVISYDSTVRLTPPPVGANLGAFDVKDYQVGEEQKLKDGRRRQEINFKICTFTTGDYIIPGMPLEYLAGDTIPKYISVDPIKISIKSLLADTTAVDTLKPRPLKAQVSLGKDYTTIYILVGALLLLGGAAAFVIIRKLRTKEKEAYVDPRPAWEIAYADLALLRDQDLPAKGEVKLFYFQLSEIFRKYLGKKFEFNAIDLTTAEISETLAGLPIEEEVCSGIDDFLDHADLVKFAKYIPPADRPDNDWNTAYSLVDRTKDIIIMPAAAIEPEPVLAGALAEVTGGDPSLKYAPPELRHLPAGDNKEGEA